MRPWNAATSLLNCRSNCINHKKSASALLEINGNCREISFLRYCNYKVRVKALKQPLGYPMIPRVSAIMVAEISIRRSSKTSLFELQCNILKKMNKILLLKQRGYQMKRLCINGPTWKYTKNHNKDLGEKLRRLKYINSLYELVHGFKRSYKMISVGGTMT